MNINQAMGGDYLKVADLQGRAITLTMGQSTLQKFDDGDKVALHFHGTEKSLLLNKTNANVIATMYGPETDTWIGQQIELYPDTTLFKGAPTPCIRVRQPAGAARHTHVPAMAAPTEPPAFHSEAPVAPLPATSGPSLDDDIPF